MKWFLRALPICTALSLASAHAANEEPSLDATLKYIQDAMNQQDTLAYSYTQSDQAGKTFRETYRISDVVGDPASCTVNIVETSEDQIEVPAGDDYLEDGQPVIGANLFRRFVERTTIPLRDIQSIRIDPLQDVWNRHAVDAAHPKRTVVITPKVYGLSMGATRPTILFHTSFTRGQEVSKTADYPSKNDTVHFRSEVLANRVAKAFRHAVERCGGRISGTS